MVHAALRVSEQAADGEKAAAEDEKAGSGEKPASSSIAGGEPERTFTAFLVGTGRSEPGVTKEEKAARIMRIVEDEANGHKVLPDVGRGPSGYCNARFLKSMTSAGEKSWRCFKATYADHIESSKFWARMLR